MDHKEKQDYLGRLTALDELACHAAEHGEWESFTELLEKMCNILETAPKLDELPLSSSRTLIENNKGAQVLPYLECWIKHLLSRDYSSGAFYIVARHIVEAYRQSGLSDQEISDKLLALRTLSSSEQVASVYTRAVERGFKSDKYPVFRDEDRDKE